MPSIRLYLDEDSMDQSLVRALRSRGLDVTTALDEGLIGSSDEEQLGHATVTGRVLCTFNAGDFHRLHTRYLREGRHHAGIIVSLQQRYTIGEQMRRLLRLTSALTAAEMEGSIEFLSAWA